jgi:ABC-type sulfate transport system substrate-binding protein
MIVSTKVAVAIYITLFCLLIVAGCSSDKVSNGTVETARSVANANSGFNARVWKTKNPAYAGCKILERGDSTQSRSCPQGDGWASIDLVNDIGVVEIPLKCSTYSVNIGCMPATDFSKKRYATEDGNCNNDMDFPITKIAK